MSVCMCVSLCVYFRICVCLCVCICVSVCVCMCVHTVHVLRGQRCCVRHTSARTLFRLGLGIPLLCEGDAHFPDVLQLSGEETVGLWRQWATKRLYWIGSLWTDQAVLLSFFG